MNIRRLRTRALPAIAAALALGLTATACGDDGDEGTGPSAGSTDTSALLGPVKQAQGAPLKVGFVTEGQTQALDATPAQEAAQAAVKYVNERLGGIAGRPLELVICESKSTPAGGADCANRMVEQKVPVVLNDISGVGAAVVGPLSAAGIPYVTYSGSSGVELNTPHAYSITGSVLSVMGGLAQTSKDRQVKKVTVISVDVPSVTQGVQGIGKPAFAKAGIDLELTAVPHGTPDILPQVQTAISNGSDALVLFGDKNLCSAGLKAAKNLAFKGQVFIVEQCIDPASVTAVPGGYDGVSMTSVNKLADGDPQYGLYKAVLRQYAPETADANARAGLAVQGYGVVVAFARAMSQVTNGDITPAVIDDALKSNVNLPAPLSGDATFSCDGSAIPQYASVCSVKTQIAKLDKNGVPTSYAPIDPTQLLR